MKAIKIFWVAAFSAVLFFAVCAQAQDKERVIYEFSRASGGAEPTGGLYLDPSSNMYGITDTGVLFELSADGSGGWNYAELTTSDCGYPTGPLVRDQAGNFYGGNFFGQICEFSPNGSGGWTSSIIYQLNAVSNAGPSTLLADAAGNLYGVDGMNGANGFGYVFELSPNSGAWSLTDIYDFHGSDGNASNAGNSAAGILGGLIMDASGNLYGVTYQGGTNPNCACGVVFELTNSSGVWSETVLHDFGGPGGANPDAPLLMDAAGNLYGTTTNGGTAGFGVIFRITFASGQPVTSILHNFTNAGGDGAYPQAALIMDSAGNLYGTTEAGGGSSQCSVEVDNGCGTAFKLTPMGNQWKESVLHIFKGGGDGGLPGKLIMGASGDLYGDEPIGGISNQGTVFEIMP